MASESRVQLSAAQQPEFYIKGISDEAAQRTSELLQANHENHHIFFNKSGFHNHIAHHVLTLFALGASPAELQQAYDDNATYQRAPSAVNEAVVADLRNPARWAAYLGREKHYGDFLVFFQREMADKGWEAVVCEYVLCGDARADNMLVRMFAGFLHPIIHLGFGIEFRQPAIVAEGLAQAAVHGDWMPFLQWEQAAEATRGKGERKTIVQLLDEVRGDEKVSGAARWEDGNKIRDGLMKRAPDELSAYVSQFTVGEDELEERTAEMINAAVYFTGAAQRPPHVVKFDFYYMHCVNSSIFFSNFLSAANAFISPPVKRRLLEWKVWNDIAMYASRASPALDLSEVTGYQAARDSGWEGVVARAKVLHDDGHCSKLVRALAHGEAVCGKFEEQAGFMVRGDMWRKLGHMAIDSVEAGEPHWVRSCGFEQAWAEVPLREGEGEGEGEGARL